MIAIIIMSLSPVSMEMIGLRGGVGLRPPKYLKFYLLFLSLVHYYDYDVITNMPKICESILMIKH